jgi:hypothetical protein
MTQNYSVVLFKNKIKKKIINKFKTDKKCNDFFKSLMDESDSIKFERKYENGYEVSYNLCGLEPKKVILDKLYYKDDFGRQIKVEFDDNDFTITRIENYKIEEFIMDYKTKKKLSFDSFFKKLSSINGYKLISKLNNKIVVQVDDDYRLYTLKNVFDCDRFADVLYNYSMSLGRTDFLIVKDYNTNQRKYLYEILVEKGFSKTYLQRLSTTHLQ